MKIGKNILKCLLSLGLATAFSFFFFQQTHNPGNITIIYMMVILFISTCTPGYLWGILSSVAGVVCVNFFFTEPYMQLDFIQKGYPLMFLGMLTISLITSTLSSRIHTQQKTAAAEKKALETIMDFNNQLLNTPSKEDMLELSVRYLSRLNDASVLYWENSSSTTTSRCHSCFHANETLHVFNQKDISRYAEYVIAEKKDSQFENRFYRYYCLPAYSSDTCFGVFFIAFLLLGEKLSLNPLTPLTVPQIVISLEHSRLFEYHHQLELDAEKEKMRATLLRAISHDLRTPLTGIIGSSSAYLENEDTLGKGAKTKLIDTIHTDAQWLLHMVENLLSITRIDQETSQVAKKSEPLEEVVAEAISRFQSRYPDTPLNVTIPEDFLLIPMDATLIEQVILNLLENGWIHGRGKQTIDFLVTADSCFASFQIRDYGSGIPADKIDTIFQASIATDRAQTTGRKGMGIGLSICKAIILAHGGTITAANRQPGAEFIFTLPLKGDDHHAPSETKSTHY